jgi:mannose-6-phosphate isomerase class I
MSTTKLRESWECWDADAVSNGPLTGSTIATLRGRIGARFLGNLNPTRIFPILTKIITAHDWLSVQVHPNDAYAQRVEAQPFGKTLCWYVLAAKRDAELVVGWSRDTSRAEYERRVADGTLAEILRKVPAKAGRFGLQCSRTPRILPNVDDDLHENGRHSAGDRNQRTRDHDPMALIIVVAASVPRDAWLCSAEKAASHSP